MNSVKVDDGRFLLTFDYNPDIIQAISRIPGRRISPDLTGWTVPVSQVAAVRQTADTYGLRPYGAARVLFLQQPPEPELNWRNGAYQLRFDYANQRQAQAAARAGAQWFEPAGCWAAPITAGAKVAAWAAATGAKIGPAAADQISAHQARLDRIAASAATTTDWQPTATLGITLFDEQRAGIEYALNVGGRLIIGDEPGVGKTAQALGLLAETQDFPAYLIVPGSLRLNWKREAARALPGRSIEILRGRKPNHRLVWADITILGYEIAHAWKDYLPPARGVVADESHMIKNPATQRTQATMEIMQAATGTRACLTGTPVLNNEKEFIPQLAAIGRLEEFGGNRFNKTYAGKPVHLNQDLRATCYLRRLKKDVWAQAPDRRWIPVYVEGDKAAMETYRKAEKDIVAFLQNRARELAIQAGASTGDAEARGWEAAMRAEAGQHLVAITHLKQLAAKAKTPACIDYAKTFLASSEEKLAAYAWHTSIVNNLADQLGAVKVQGGMTDATKDAAVTAFQTDPKTRTFVGQIATAGVGLTLTAASKAMILEQGWTPGIMDQVLDRHHRRGQEHDVIGWLMLIEDTIDQDIYTLIQQKRKLVDQVTDGEERSPEETGGTVLADLLIRLASRGTDES